MQAEIYFIFFLLTSIFFKKKAGSPFFGWLGDKIKQRRLPMLLGIAASMAANYMFMFSITYWMLLLARFLQGVSNACVWTMSLCLIADNWPSNQLGAQMGKLVGFYPLGLLVGLPTGGILYSKLGPQTPFIAASVLTGIDFLMRLVIIEPAHSPKEWFDDDHRKRNMDDNQSEMTIAMDLQEQQEQEQKQDEKKKKVTTIQLLKHPRLIVSLALTIVTATVMSAFEVMKKKKKVFMHIYTYMLKKMFICMFKIINKNKKKQLFLIIHPLLTLFILDIYIYIYSQHYQ